MHITLISSQSQLAFHSCSSERKRPRSIASIMASKALLVLALLLAATFLVASANEQAREFIQFHASTVANTNN
jgi:hypothetical protein